MAYEIVRVFTTGANQTALAIIDDYSFRMSLGVFLGKTAQGWQIIYSDRLTNLEPLVYYPDDSFTQENRARITQTVPESELTPLISDLALFFEEIYGDS
ncbi:hypothetical protein [Spirochaeta lutea]|uniref:Uncharacterized protein n=1 Tax=Spirochaeta lutea TaxID=1480694 RepID=A0A098QWG6_9SPIO|nr:hypothetical protein [Spirochaeta lutea]KGE72069.1 hypothetical protein DC28_08180 [Spirochaeta lutea]